MAPPDNSKKISVMTSNLDLENLPKYNFHGRRMGRGLKDHQKLTLHESLCDYEIHINPDEPFSYEKIFDQKPSQITLEIGSGGGEHCAALAALEPNHSFIAAEAYIKGVASLLTHIQDRQLKNIRIFADDVRLLLDQLPNNSLDRVIILFADPWPKTRHHERRMVQESNLKRIVELLKPQGTLRIATDHAEYLTWMIEHLKRVPALIPQFSWNDLPTARPEGWPPTRYEQKALKAGRGSVYMEFVRK